MALEPREQIAALSSTLLTVEKVMNLESMRAEIVDLETQASAPNLWDDQAHAQSVTSRLSFLQAELNRVVTLRRRLDDVAVLLELAEMESDADSFAEVDKECAAAKARPELAALAAKASAVRGRWRIASTQPH